MFKALKSDIIAGFSVFLLSLPLCLGIAIASNFPPIAGILTAIVGGLLTPVFGGNPMTIKGPAAGLIVMVLGAVQELGQGDALMGYQLTLAVGVAAAALQILIAYLKKAIIAEIIPPSVIHGMLAAIGVIIISKQMYVLMGITPLSAEPLLLLFNLPTQALSVNPIIFGIGLLSLAIVILWPRIKVLAFVPSSIVILLMVIPLSLYFHLNVDHLYSFLGHTYVLEPNVLVNLPMNFFDAFHFPDFSQILTPVSLKYTIMFTLLGSLESLLTICAIDALSGGKMVSDLNKDLRAVGLANLVSSCIGGLPMISEIVRSKANIDYGAISVKANFFHGLFMLIAVLFLPTLINLIPLSSLAALLIFVGLKLASPHQFVHAYKIGKDQLALLLTTFVVTLKTDLLIGVATGIFLKIILHWRQKNSLKNLFSPLIAIEMREDRAIIRIEGALTFMNYLKLKKEIDKLMNQTNKLTISLSEVTYLDYTVISKIQALHHQFKNSEIIIQANPQFAQFYTLDHSQK